MRTRVGITIVSLLAVALGAAGKNPPHNDVFTAGPVDEAQLAQKIRHELLMLPYYSIFDRPRFQVEWQCGHAGGRVPSRASLGHQEGRGKRGETNPRRNAGHQ